MVPRREWAALGGGAVVTVRAGGLGVSALTHLLYVCVYFGVDILHTLWNVKRMREK